MQRLAMLALAACHGAITLEVASDRPIPQALDAICVGVGDASLHGGQFGSTYQLTGKLATLPQTLRVEPGSASAAWAWVRGDRGGVPVALAEDHFDFGGDVTLALDRCVKGPAAAPHAIGAAIGPPGALLAASEGVGGTLVVAVGADGAQVIDARGGSLTSVEAPMPPPGKPIAVLAADVDGDCDDDVIVATDSAPPELWIRDGGTFVDATAIPAPAVAAIAAADVDHDGAIDLVLGGGAKLQLLRNDGGGNFTPATNAFTGAAPLSAISALALGDFDGDGNADLIVGQAGGPLVGYYGQGGAFSYSAGLVPALMIDVEAMVIADASYDLIPDLAVSVRGGAMHLYITRDGKLEDRSYMLLPQMPPVAAHAVAIGGWDDGCEPDLVAASDAGAPMLRGTPGGVFAAEDAAPAATDVVMADIDDDGDLDALFATDGGVQWLAR